MSGIVLTTDLSEASQRAFAPCVDLAGKLGLPILLLGVVEDLPFEPAAGGLMATYPDRGRVIEDWRTELARLAKGLGQGATSHVVDAMDVPHAIVEFAERNKADFIAMATHGRSGLRRLLVGSVAEAVMRHSHVPVIAFPPPAEKR